MKKLLLLIPLCLSSCEHDESNTPKEQQSIIMDDSPYDWPEGWIEKLQEYNWSQRQHPNNAEKDHRHDEHETWVVWRRANGWTY